jgi:hypothetical protein
MEFTILEKNSINSFAMREGSVVEPEGVLISVMGERGALLVVASLRISQVFFGSFLQLKRQLA